MKLFCIVPMVEDLLGYFIFYFVAFKNRYADDEIFAF